MNMIKKIILGSFLLILMTGCQGNITEVSSNTNNECNHKAQLLVEQKDRKIYTYCLNDITIKLNNQEENKTYEFEFQLYSDAKNIEDSVNYIFKNSTIVEIRETDRMGLEQLQESMMEK